MSMISERAEAAPPIGAVAGPHLIGYFLNWGLFGVLCVQVFLYYLAFPKDRKSMKLLVYFLLALDTVQTILITNDAFEKYGLEFSNPAGLSKMRNAWFSIPTISAINGTAVQLFFAYRIATLSGSKILGGFVALLAVTGGAGGLAAGVKSRIVNNLATIAVKARTELTIWLSISGACDVIIAVCMVVILSRKKTGFNTATDDAITRIIRLTVETGSLTAVLAIITVALFFGFPTRAYWNVPIDVLGKLYSNNLMVILNRRIKITDGRSSNSGGGGSHGGPQQTTSARSLEFSSRPHFNFHTNSGGGGGGRHGGGGIGSGGVDMPIKIRREVWEESVSDNGDVNIKMEDMPVDVGSQVGEDPRFPVRSHPPHPHANPHAYSYSPPPSGGGVV
ncbi:hypothetical protein E1B28_013737 [Marasmius oreades]|uniref:DUF6534 domain-containing protein n=1 Tax=Marasmius oreades TaxID=181124 RepID=A0A9P7UPA9_9AGAR|nr:uncharacterized protein E1B28_013737 [Marasmius oreades]KAG7087796.1 hypothetical protein E1B28_013737 [Marasmius oreades]